MTVGFVSVIISLIIGIIVGGIAGYYAGKVDILLMRVAEVVGSLPFIPLALILSALIGNKVSEVGRIIMIMVILGILSWPGVAYMYVPGTCGTPEGIRHCGESARRT